MLFWGKTYDVHVLQIIVLSNKRITERSNGCGDVIMQVNRWEKLS